VAGGSLIFIDCRWYQAAVKMVSRIRRAWKWLISDWNADVQHTTVIRDNYDQLLDGIKTCLDDDRTADFIQRLRLGGVIDELENGEIDELGNSGQQAEKLLSILSRPSKTVTHFEELLATQGFPARIATTVRRELSITISFDIPNHEVNTCYTCFIFF
jgi:hypothetical protein